MHDKNELAGIDLNLLTVLEALLAERHVSRAALRLNKSQPAVSHALARLRALFGDPLLVRGPDGLRPTGRAEQLAGPLAEALAHLRILLGPPDFEPAAARLNMRIAMSDYGGAVVLPGLVSVLRARAPGITLTMSEAHRDRSVAAILDGRLDLAWGVFPDCPDGVTAETLFEERFVCILDRDSLTSGFDLSAYLKRPHILVAAPDRPPAEVDLALAAIGERRTVAMTLPHWSAAGDLVIGTDLVLTVAERTLQTIPDRRRLAVVAPPFPIAPFRFVQIWHRRRENDPGHRWLRQQAALPFR